jgi:1-acyl-sn-glycerol-3-phosphate acyltransferase
MLSFLPPTIRGLLAAFFLGLNTVLLCIPIYFLALLKLIPIKPWRSWLSTLLILIAESWIDVNKMIIHTLNQQQWDVRGVENLNLHGWYLVTSNHQSWADIFILQAIFNHHIPFLKFFIKQELFWAPVIGLAWWALDFPFMKRYSKAYLARHPEKRGEDLQTTRKACEKFKKSPISVMNFLEGTRMSSAKHAQQESPFRHLLRPKAGGIALVLDILGSQIRTLLDVTIVYPDGVPTIWDFLCGRTEKFVVRVHKQPIPAHLWAGDYQNDPQFKAQFQGWVNDFWHKKDAFLDQLLTTEKQSATM